MLSTPSLTIAGDDLVVREWLRRRKRFALRSIRRIESVKIDKVTYEENHLLLELDGGKVVSLGQLDRGFQAVEERLRARFDPFDPDWMARLEDGPAGQRRLIWERPDDT
jgi:hypothetical protein